MRFSLTFVGVLIVSAAFAEAPTSSLPPAPRPGGLLSPETVAPIVAAVSLIPLQRPAGLATRAVPEPKSSPKPKGGKGQVCGDADIKGEMLAAIAGTRSGCGLSEPVRVSAIEGVTLAPAATISCDTALAMKKWIKKGLAPAFGSREVIELRVAASYICRTRNNQKGAKISEHGRGNAIDISAFVLANGTVLTVEDDYTKAVRKAHKAACGIFGTTLGPGSDGFHEDHLHFDIARHNGGPYCR